jgi:hypothetical protein
MPAELPKRIISLVEFLRLKLKLRLLRRRMRQIVEAQKVPAQQPAPLGEKEAATPRKP